MLTNAHVLRGEEVAVAFADGRTEHGRVAGADADLDLAAIAVDTGDAPAVAWDPERPGAVGIGEPVFALANPGGRGLRATFGMVSRDRPLASAARAGAASAARSSTPRRCRAAPPAARSSTREHRLLGLNSIRLEGGLILALPADAAMQRRAEALASGSAAERPRLGIAIAPARAARRMRAAVGLPERDGLLVRGVVEDSPAAKAGVRAGRPARRRQRHARCPPSMRCSMPSRRAASSTLDVLRGTEERDGRNLTSVVEVLS